VPHTEQMEVNYELTADDLAALTWHHSQTSPLMRRYYWVGLLLPPAAYLLLALLFLGAGQPSFYLFPLLFSFAYLLLFPRLRRRRINSYVRRLVREGRNKGTLGPHRMAISREGLVDATEVGEAKTLWAGIERVEESADYIFIYKSALSAYVVPKRAFRDAHQSGQFFAAARAYQQQPAAGYIPPGATPPGGTGGGHLPPTPHYNERALTPVERLFDDESEGQ
jgi:hypothetical protein